MSDIASQHSTVRQWAEYVIEKWRDKLNKLKIDENGYLWDSLAYEVVTGSNGDVDKVIFFYNYYGAFVDMGVGKGTKLSNVFENRLSRHLEGRMTGNRRRAKRWYSKTIYGQTRALADIMQKHYGKLAAGQIIESFPGSLTLNI